MRRRRISYSRVVTSTVLRDPVSIRGPEDVAREMKRLFDRHPDQEAFYVVTLNTKNQVLGEHLVFLGSLNASIVHPREVLKHAVACDSCERRAAACLILVHNHPTGDPHPSSEDVEFTRRMDECCKLMGVSLHDHVIIGNGRHYSLKESGVI